MEGDWQSPLYPSLVRGPILYTLCTRMTRWSRIVILRSESTITELYTSWKIKLKSHSSLINMHLNSECAILLSCVIKECSWSYNKRANDHWYIGNKIQIFPFVLRLARCRLLKGSWSKCAPNMVDVRKSRHISYHEAFLSIKKLPIVPLGGGVIALTFWGY